MKTFKDHRLEEAKKGTHVMTRGDYAIYKRNGITEIRYKGTVVGDGDFDSGADGWFIKVPGKKGQQAFTSHKDILDYFKKNKITSESVELDEAKQVQGSKNIEKIVDALEKVEKLLSGPFSRAIVNDAPEKDRRIVGQMLNNKANAVEKIMDDLIDIQVAIDENV